MKATLFSQSQNAYTIISGQNCPFGFPQSCLIETNRRFRLKDGTSLDEPSGRWLKMNRLAT